MPCPFFLKGDHMPVITTKKDAYGFIEQTIDPEYNAKRVDPIGEELGTPGYLENHYINGVMFKRYYFQANLLIDLNMKDESEIMYKVDMCKTLGMVYIPVMAGSNLKASQLHNEIKKQTKGVKHV